MKPVFTSITILCLASFIYAEDPIPPGFTHPVEERIAPLPELVDIQIVEDLHLPATKKSSLYFRLGGGETTNIHVLPGMGFGYRWSSGVSAIDISTNYTRQLSKDHHKNYLYTLPKISYLRYLDNNDQSFYVGGGLAWGSLRKHTVSNILNFYTPLIERFDGVIGHILLGYELGRTQKWCSFFELSVSQPALPLEAISSYRELPGPFGEFMIGFGF